MATHVQEEQYKVLTVRLIADDMERLKEAAEHVGVGPTVLARMLIRQGLQGQGEGNLFPFATLHSLLAPLATEKDSTERGLTQRMKQVHRKRWEEQYEKSAAEIRKRRTGT